MIKLKENTEQGRYEMKVTQALYNDRAQYDACMAQYEVEILDKGVPYDKELVPEFIERIWEYDSEDPTLLLGLIMDPATVMSIIAVKSIEEVFGEEFACALNKLAEQELEGND